MARQTRGDKFRPDEVATVLVVNRVVRRCFLAGNDPLTGKNFDHRKLWIEQLIRHQVQFFAIDVLAYDILTNEFQQVLRSRPDVVATWDDTEVARRWLMICPIRKGPDGQARNPTEVELNSIRADPLKLQEICSRLSDISWWMRLLCQKIAQRANAEEGLPGKFWESGFRAVRILDEQSVANAGCELDIDLDELLASVFDCHKLTRSSALDLSTVTNAQVITQPVPKKLVL